MIFEFAKWNRIFSFYLFVTVYRQQRQIVPYTIPAQQIVPISKARPVWLSPEKSLKNEIPKQNI